MCNCSSFRENCVTHTHARTHTHGANYNLPPASRARDKKILNYLQFCQYPPVFVSLDSEDLKIPKKILKNTLNIDFSDF